MRYWLSFDLGLQGNYEDLYGWLDDQEAVECGDSMSSFKSDLTPETITSQLKNLLRANKNARVYLIHERTGKFIIGKRKRAPWTGYSTGAFDGVDEE